MANVLRLLVCFCILYDFLTFKVYCTTHWVVTEDGKIQAQMDSLFQLRRPYDFLALAQQEQRAVHVEELKQKLIKHKEHIDSHDDKQEMQLEERIYRTDVDCILAGKPLTQFDLLASTSVQLSDYPQLRVEEVVPQSDADGPVLEPDCVEGYSLPAFNMAALDHLQSIQERENLTGSPELSLMMLGVKDMPDERDDYSDNVKTSSDGFNEEDNDERTSGLLSDQQQGSSSLSPDPYEDDLGEDEPAESEEVTSSWGDRIARALFKEENKKQWLVYSLATQYWRIRGRPTEAVECARRALYLVPRVYRHIPLVQLGNVLHRSRHAHDAAITLHMALDHHRTLYSAHITLGHVYASLALFNVSVVCYGNAAVVRPHSPLPRRLKNAVLCHAHLEDALQQQHMSLEKTLAELQQYQLRHEEWLALQQKLLMEQATPEMKLESRLEYEEQKIRESSDGRGQDCFQYQQDGHTFLSCNMRRDQLEHRTQPPDLTLDVTSLMHSVQGEALRVNQLRTQPSSGFISTSGSSQSGHSGGSSGNSGGGISIPITVLQSVPQLQPKEVQSKAKNKQQDLSKEDYGSLLLEEMIAHSVTPEQCEEIPVLPNWDGYPVVLFTPDSKGNNNIKDILTDYEITKPSEPYHPPICERLTKPLPASLEAVKQSGVSVPPCSEAQEYLAALNIGDLHQVGDRIAQALQLNIGSKWVVHNLAALYWRAVGNMWNGVECLRGVIGSHESLLSSPKDGNEEEEEEDLELADDPDEMSHSDVALGNLASVLYAAGSVDDALIVARKAAELASGEGECLFLLGNLLSAKGNLTGAYQSYKQLTSLHPNHPHGERFMSALACHCHNAAAGLEATQSSTTSFKGRSADQDSEGTCQGDEIGSAGDGSEEKETLFITIYDRLNFGDDESSSSGKTQTSSGDVKDNEKEDEVDDSSIHYGEHHSSLSDILPVLSDSLTPPQQSFTSAATTEEEEQEEDSSMNDSFELLDDPLPDTLLKGTHRALASPVAPFEPQLCEGYKRNVALRHFTSTWLSVSAKFIDISYYLEPAPSVLPQPPVEPICPEVPVSLLTMDHLSGVKHRNYLPHFPEMGLLEALHTLLDPPQSIEQMAYVLHTALKRHPAWSGGGWIVLTGAALYWRVEGNANRAVNCLRAALHYAPREMKDVPLTSLANVLHRSGLFNNAMVVANHALEISPKFVVIHFTIANIYAAMDELEKASTFYQSTLALQSTFEPARDRLRAIQCDKWWSDEQN